MNNIYFYVDSAGNDSKPGTRDQPFQHINYAVKKAAQQNALGKIAVVSINPGRYREAVIFPTQPYTNNMITLQASDRKNLPILDGADIWSRGWTLVSGAIYSHPYTPQPPASCTSASCSPSDLEPEQVWFNGRLLQQTQSRALKAAGQFFLDRTGQKIYVWAPGSVNPNSTLTEVTTRSELLKVIGPSQLTIDGLVVQRSADLPCTGDTTCPDMIDIEGVNSNLTLRHVTAKYSSSVGLFITCAGGAGGSCGGNGTGTFMMHDVHADDNGFAGMGIQKAKNLNATNITTSRNTWKEKLPGSLYQDAWETGVKFGSLHDAIINGWTADENWSPAFWPDTDVARVTISNLVVRRNNYRGSGSSASGQGIFIEAVQGPLTITSAVACQNSVLAQSSDNITLGSTPGSFIVFLNDTNAGSLEALFVGDDEAPTGREVKDFETGVTVFPFGKNWTIRHVALWVRNAGLKGDFVWHNGQDAKHAATFWSTLVADYNVYWDPQLREVFNRDVHAPPVDYNQYRTWVPGREAHSVWASPFLNDPTSTCTFTGVGGVWPR